MRRLKKVVGKSHPNVYEIVKVFKMEEATAQVTLAQLQAGARQPPQRRATMCSFCTLYLVYYLLVRLRVVWGRNITVRVGESLL